MAAPKCHPLRERPRRGPFRRAGTAALLGVVVLVCAGCVGLRPVESARRTLSDPRLVATGAGAVFLEVAGGADRPTVALVHGFGGSSYSWREVVPALAGAGFRVLALDLPGFGYSDRPVWPVRYTPAGQAETVAEVLTAFGAGVKRPVHLVGHSFGGGVALELALRHPELVRSLVLVDSTLPTFSRAPNADWPLYRPFAYLLARTLGLRRLFVRGALEKAYHDDSLVTPALVDAYRDRLVLRGPATAYRGLVSTIPRERLALDLRRIETPTLVVWGEEDALIPLRAGRKAAERLPNATLATLPGCGHLPMEECPERFLAAVTEFLERGSDSGRQAAPALVSSFRASLNR